MPLSNNLQLFRRKDNDEEVHFVRASTLGHYWFCAVQAWLQASGIDNPPNEALSIGKAIHDDITNSRRSSALETEFQDFIKQFMVVRDTGHGSTGLATEENKVFMRAWYDGSTVLGHITTHGIDDFRVNPNREIVITEYKTTGQKVVDHFKLWPAVFQIKVYMWILEPYLAVGGYKIQYGEVTFLDRRGNPLGTKEIRDYSAKDVEFHIGQILEQFRDPSKLIPCARWKCLHCDECYKSRCPFAVKPPAVGESDNAERTK